MIASASSPPVPDRPWSVEVVADSDSRWKWGATVAQRLVDGHPADLHATLLLGRSVPNDRQLDDIGVAAASLRRASLAETITRLRDTDADVVVLACIGGCVQSLLQALSRAWTGRTRRPVVVTGYVGLVYEKVADGLINRVGADLLLANCPADAARFADILLGLGADPDSVVATALPFLGGDRYDPTKAGRSRPYTLTFVSQPGVPATKEDRTHVLRQACRYARQHPEHEVIMKLRARQGERTTHVEPYHYEALLTPTELPANLRFAYGAMDAVLDATDLCLTVSSTAAIEAMHRGIPTGVLTDYGVRELLGNPLFIGSGALIDWPAVLRGELPSLRPEWASAHGVTADADAYEPAARRLRELIERRDRLPALRPWLNADTAGAYLPGLLARYGLDADASPVARPSDPTIPPTRTRRAVRKVARRTYRYGVRVLEPRIKRLAQL